MFETFKKLFQAKKPNAAFIWQQLGNFAGDAYWFYAVPVHLVLQRDSFSLVEPVPLSLDKIEADALTTSLNKHFEQDDMRFFWHENQWFLALQHNPHIETTAPEVAINKEVSRFLPTGAGAIKWASFQNELQMLLFEHAVNQSREIKGQPAVSSIWCYGGGQLQHAS